MTVDDILLNLKKELTPKRFDHSVNVANLAKELAELYGVCPVKAYTAGLVHDCAKCMDEGELLECIQKYKIHLEHEDRVSPQLWHSYVGAYLAKEIYGIEDEDILNAIYYHTTGKPGMTKLEAIIYLADAIEPLRSYEGVEELRNLARQSLWDAVFCYTEKSIDFVLEKGSIVHPNSIDLRNELISNRRQK